MYMCSLRAFEENIKNFKPKYKIFIESKRFRMWQILKKITHKMPVKTLYKNTKSWFEEI